MPNIRPTESTIIISKSAARRFLIHAFALDGFQKLPDVASAVANLTVVQMDSINVCGRMHDLILRVRVQGYQSDDLHRYLYHERQGFEHYFPNLSVLPAAMYPLLLPKMRERAAVPGRWHGLFPEEQPIADELLARMDTEGAIRARTADSVHGYTTSGWGTRAKLAGHVLEKLWLQGTIAIAHRANFERWFDRTERLYPDLARQHFFDGDLLSAEELAAEEAYRRLRMRRLFRRSKDSETLRKAGKVVKVRIEGIERDWFALSEDADRLADGDNLPIDDKTVHLLAPLDPLVYDRERLRDLWDFDYTWEVYTPQSKRRWGYYALPVLQGEHLVARVDLKADRKANQLLVPSLHWEIGVDKSNMQPLLEKRLREFAVWNGVGDLLYTVNE